MIWWYNDTSNFRQRRAIGRWGVYKVLPCSFTPFSLFAVLALLPSLPPLSLLVSITKKENILIVSWSVTFSRLFVQIWCNLPFVFVLKIDRYFFVENHRFSKIPVIRKSMRFPWKTMILPMSHARPNDKFGSGWSQHCLNFSTFWCEAMKNLEAVHFNII